MRYFILAGLPIALSFACAHQQSASVNTPTTTTSAEYSVHDAGVTETPSQGWDNSRSHQVQDAPPPVMNDSISR